MNLSQLFISCLGSLLLFASQSWGAPVFTAHPARNQIVDEKTPVTFTVAAEGSSALSFQWLRNGLPIAGANANSLTLASVQYSDRGFYQVKVADSTSISRSHAGFLNVRVPNEIIAWGNFAGAVPVGLSDVLAISVGSDRVLQSGFCLALKSDGTVAGWNGAPAVPAGLSDVVAIAAGGHHCLALKSDGTVIAWGQSIESAGRVPDGLSEVVAIAAGAYTDLALKEDGTVVEWHNRVILTGVDPEVSHATDVSAIGAGQTTILALKSDRTPIPSTRFPGAPTDLIAISEGGFSLALKSNGTVVSSKSDVPGGLSDVVAIAAGDSHSLALKSDGTVAAWGDNSQGATDVPAGLARVIAINAGNHASLALRRISKPLITVQPQPATQTLGGLSSVIYSVTATGNGLSYQWSKDGVPISGATASSFTNGRLSSYDAGGYTVTVSNSLGSVTSNPVLLLVAGPTFTKDPEPSQVAIHVESVTISAAATGSGSLSYQWLHNGMPVAGATGSSMTLAHAQYGDRGYYQLKATDALGTTISRAGFLNVLVPGTLKVWGYNPNGANTPPAGLTGVVAFSGGYDESLALKSDGTVVAWGDNDAASHVPAGLSNVVAISCGLYDVALKSDGTIVAWNRYGSGENAIFAGLSGIVAVSEQYVVKSDGTIGAWNFPGGQASLVGAGVSNAALVSASGNHLLALKSNGTVSDFPFYNSNLPVPANLAGVTAISARGEFSLALKSDGTVAAWGSTEYGRSALPAGLSGIIHLSAGSDHVVALKDDGTVIAWGAPESWVYGGQANVPPGLGYVVAIEAGAHHNLELEIPSPTPEVTTKAATAIDSSSATFNAEVIPGALPTSVYFQLRTASLSYRTITASQQAGRGNTPVNISASATGLPAGKTLYYRAVAANSRIIVYGADQAFTTSSAANPFPLVISVLVSGIPSDNRIFNATINPNGSAASAYFEYGATSAYGSKTAAQNVTAGNDEVAVSATEDGLLGNQPFHYRVVVANANGISYGEDQTFTASAAAPLLSKPFFQTRTSDGTSDGFLIIRGICNPNGSATKMHVEFINTYMYYGITQDQEIGNGWDPVPISFKVPYYRPTYDRNEPYRVVATNAQGKDVALSVYHAFAWAVDDTISIGAKPVQIDVLSNDISFSGYTPAISSVTQGDNGTVSINSDLTLQYSPGRNFSSSDTFTYTIPDGLGGFSTATVKVLGDSTVTPSAYPSSYVGVALSNPALHETGAYLRATVTKTGAFTGRLQYAGYSFA
ncbi:MAG: hypothetical protein JWL59_749, partial [Chthoniobacteraceae bacterium]|nr:hypothetical protein [Chthoniobacteraceae bacterium]